MKRVAILFLLAVFVCALQGCGVRRDLRLPDERDEPRQEEKQESSPYGGG